MVVAQRVVEDVEVARAHQQAARLLPQVPQQHRRVAHKREAQVVAAREAVVAQAEVEVAALLPLQAEAKPEAQHLHRLPHRHL